jgi:hypothetical protein
MESLIRWIWKNITERRRSIRMMMDEVPQVVQFNTRLFK